MIECLNDRMIEYLDGCILDTLRFNKMNSIM